MCLPSASSQTLIALCLLLFAALSVQAQSNAQEGTRLNSLEAQIAQDEALLAQTIEAEEVSEAQLDALDRQIAMREALVQEYKSALLGLQLQRDSLRVSLNALEGELGALKREYEARATHVYMHGRMHDLALILAASSINQMLVRIRYLQRFAQERRRKLATIEQASERVFQQRDALQAAAEETEVLLAAAEAEEEVLQTQLSERAQLVQRLRRQRSSLESTIAENKSLRDELRALISRASSSGSSTRTRSEPTNMSGSFSQNKGQLPWPSEGVVLEPFGEVVNPLHGTVTNNPGILLATAAQAEVKAVFSGQVLSIEYMPEFGTFLVVEHNNGYQTVYGNLSMTNVTEGDYVQAGEIIGRSGTDYEPRGRAVFFGVFGENGEQNPESWLASR